MNGILHILEDLKKQFKGDFLITKEVKKEIIDHPLKIKRFKLGALQLKDLFDRKIIKHANINAKQIYELRKKRDWLMTVANSTFKARDQNIHIIDKGESAALALSLILQGNNPIVIDERTTRMLCENPENVRKILQKKLRTNVQAKKEQYKEFKNFKIIRSTELAYIAHKKNLLHLKSPEVYGAMLYGLKYKGCSISENEIEQMKRL